MKQLDNTPLWVQLAWANVPTRKVAIWLIISCVLFALYCVPWAIFTANALVAKLFLLHDWWWFASMIPLTIWYWLALKWVDNHAAWE
jgi:hypothetical protein